MIYPWQASVWRTVQAARQRGQLPHALLFSGQDGCGNPAFIQALAQSLLCLHPQADGAACGECRSCRVFAAQAHPDHMAVSLLEDKQAILIEQIRELNHFLGLSRSYSPCRVATIQPAERMNVNAANSLLKSLEEPAPDTHILLLTAQPTQLLPTIRSRCQQLALPLPAWDDALAWLQAQQPAHPPADLLVAAGGRPLAALEYASNDMLQQQAQWLQHLMQWRHGQVALTDVSAHWEKFDRTLLLDWQLAWLCQYLGQCFGAGQANAAATRLFAQLDTSQAWAIHAQLLELKKLAAHPLNARSFVEAMVVLWPNAA